MRGRTAAAESRLSRRHRSAAGAARPAGCRPRNVSSPAWASGARVLVPAFLAFLRDRRLLRRSYRGRAAGPSLAIKPLLLVMAGLDPATHGSRQLDDRTIQIDPARVAL